MKWLRLGNIRNGISINGKFKASNLKKVITVPFPVWSFPRHPRGILCSLKIFLVVSGSWKRRKQKKTTWKLMVRGSCYREIYAKTRLFLFLRVTRTVTLVKLTFEAGVLLLWGILYCSTAPRQRSLERCFSDFHAPLWAREEIVSFRDCLWGQGFKRVYSML